MKILIVNQPYFNRGDEAAHKALIRSLLARVPNLQIRVLSYVQYMESIRQFSIDDDRVQYIYEPMGYKRHSFFWYGMRHSLTLLWNFNPVFWKLRRIYRWADLILCAPGGICMGGFQAWQHLFHLKLAQFYHRPLAYYGRSFGPFPTATKDNRVFKERSLEMLHYFSFLSIRDKKSEELAKELGINYVSTVDSAFLETPETDIPFELRAAIKNLPYMVFVPNYLLWHYAYCGRVSHETVMNFYSRVMDEVWAQYPDYHIVMLPQLFGEKDYALRDVDFFRDLAMLKNDSRVIVTPDCYSSDIQQSVIGGARFVIGARYHSIVFAINQGVPFVALSYEHKISGLLGTLELTDYCVDFTHSLDSVENQTETIQRVRLLISRLSPNPEGRERAKAIASDCFNKFVEFLCRL